MSSTRDQVLDALWPDLEPLVAVNSLNQTVYFLRRVFESTFVGGHVTRVSCITTLMSSGSTPS